MTLAAERIDPPVEDPVSNVLKWVLMVVAILTFALLAWATTATYRLAPPQPDRFVGADGAVLMTNDDVVAGKGGFQKADLMDYGSLYGMGSYYGEDYTASTLVRLGTETQNNVSLATTGKAFAALTTDQQAAATAVMQHDLQTIDLTKTEVVLPPPVAAAIVSVRDDLSKSLNVADPPAGWTPAYSLNPQLAKQTADFLVFSALTTVARRPGVTWSWTENWPFEPMVGNTPTTNTFRWTWISFCFTFFAFGVVLFIYEFFLNNPDDAPMDPVLATFRPLTPSQKRISKYFSWSRRFCWSRSWPASSWRTLIMTGRASTASRSTTSCPSTPFATCISKRRSFGSDFRGSARRCSWRPPSPAARKRKASTGWWIRCSG